MHIMDNYAVVRFYADLDIEAETLATGVSLAEAREWCEDDESSSATAKSPEAVRLTKNYGDWFIGYVRED